MTTKPKNIIAYTSEGDRLAYVRKAAVETAKEAGACLILYDIDAASAFSKPLPTWWSSSDPDRDVPSRLSVEDLQQAGRVPIAEQVEEARAAGIDAWGWLPGEQDGETLADYANERRADLIMVPASLDDPGFMDKIRNATLESVEEHFDRSIALVHEDGRIEMSA